MPAIKLEQFGGMLPAWDPHLLPTGQAAQARNGYLFSGSLVGWRRPKKLRDLAHASTRTVYRVPTIRETQAIAYLFMPSQPVNGDTVTIGELTYTWRANINSVNDGGEPQDVLIGASTNESARNLVAAITADNNLNTNAGVWYGDNTVSNGQVKFYIDNASPTTGLQACQQGAASVNSVNADYVFVGSTDFGAAFNLTGVSESTAGVRMIWLKDLLSLSDTTTTYAGGSNPSFDNLINGAATWMEFDDPDTNVVKSPVVDDRWNRYYWASPSQPPQYNTYDRIVAGQPAWLLGVSPPGCAPILAVEGGGNSLTLGNYTQSGGSLQGRGNYIYLTKITTPGSTQINDVQFRLSDSILTGDDPNCHFAAVVYEDNAGLPSALLNTGAVVTGIRTTEPNQSAFVNPTSLLANTDYWIGFMIDLPKLLSAGPAGGASNTAMFENTFSNGPPSTISSQAAHTILTSDGTNVANGDVVVIGLQSYVFQTVLTNVPGHVLIGANAAASLANLTAAINLSAGAGTTYAASTSASLYVTAAVTSSTTVAMTALTNNIDGDGVTTAFNPVGSPPHLSFPKATLQQGLAMTQPGINMWGDFATSDVVEARSYVYTWVSEYGEEGPPSPAALLNGWSNGTWTVNLWQPPPDDLGIKRNLKKLNLYRTVVGQGGQTVFFYVDTVDIGTLVYVDTKPDNTVAFNNQLPSTFWFPPPENLQGVTVLPNGMVAGFVNNEVWFCEPFHTHAWPPKYVLTTDFPIVGLGVTNGSLVACTAANPYVLSGVTPGNMTMNKCSQVDPCISRASILGGDAAVSFMSPNGLIQVTAQGAASNTTDLWFTRENWKQLTPQKYPRAIYMASCYYCLGSVSPSTVSPVDVSDALTGFSIELDQDNTSFTIWPQPGGHRLGFEVLDSPVGGDSPKNVYNLLTDPWTGIGLVIADGSVYYFDFSDPAPDMIPYTWRSKVYQQNNKRNYEAMKVFFKIPTNTPAQNADVTEADTTDPIWVGPLPAGMYGIIRTFADVDGSGSLTMVSAREIRKSGGLLRLPDGFKAEQWQWEITARVVISNAQIATTAKELANV